MGVLKQPRKRMTPEVGCTAVERVIGLIFFQTCNQAGQFILGYLTVAAGKKNGSGRIVGALNLGGCAVRFAIDIKDIIEIEAIFFDFPDAGQASGRGTVANKILEILRTGAVEIQTCKRVSRIMASQRTIVSRRPARQKENHRAFVA